MNSLWYLKQTERRLREITELKFKPENGQTWIPAELWSTDTKFNKKLNKAQTEDL